MQLRYELLANAIANSLYSMVNGRIINIPDWVDSVAVNVLGEIKDVIRNEEIEDDFEVVEEIVNIFEKYRISAGTRHDFG